MYRYERVFSVLNWFTQKHRNRCCYVEEDIQLYDPEDDFDDLNLKDDLEDNSITNEVDSNILEIENSINLNLALNNTDQTLVLDEVIDHGKKDFDVDALVNQRMQMRKKKKKLLRKINRMNRVCVKYIDWLKIVHNK
ncbi:hypothetical protein F8M41_025601 [Gigaspora margarita]|uniref:Uncharacterized protein n=1 Tax=Gigaspora margarita TaxID=4874 RepID=A0A8H4AAY5_GIGMA|nr:hypothetical protein F8M41_025601 [Gigaspora margarita]